jgi:hypothetical protein
MPPINGNFDGIKHKLPKLEHRGWKGIEAALTRPVQQQLLRVSVLSKKEVKVKLNDPVIVKSKMMN